MSHGVYAPDGSYRCTLVNLEGDPVTFNFEVTDLATQATLESVLSVLEAIQTELEAQTTLLETIATNTE